MKFRFVSSIILLIIFACVLMMNGDVFIENSNEVVNGEIENSDWYSAAMKNIEESEYYIRYNDNTNTFQSPNRKNNLRFHYFDNGFTVEPRDSEAKWNIGIYLLSYGRDDLKDYTGGELETDKNTGIMKNDNISIEYINNNKGMRENFIVHKRINGEGLLELHLRIDGNAEYEVNSNGIIFKKNSEKVMEYRDLYVYDKNNKELESRFVKTKNGIKILVNDIDAVYPITIDPLSTTADWMGESDQVNANYGISVSSAGDVNGDGYSDVIVGANGYDNGESNEGAAFVYYGSSSGLSTTADWMGESDQASAFYGNSVSSAGDVNGDGYSDIIVGSWFYNGADGAAFVYYGSSSGLSTTADWTNNSGQGSALYGYSVSSAGDVNGDGYSDVIVGATYYDDGEANEGGAFVYYGSSTGLSAAADWIGNGNQIDAYYGYSVSSAGDVNGDGYSDIVVGANEYDNGETDEGAAFLYYGGSTGLSATADWMGESDQIEANYGNSVSSAGDINGDGYSDIIVGANEYENVETDEGAVFVYYGSSTGLSAAADWMTESNQANAEYGRSISSAGDINGDGYSDIIIGAYLYDNGESNEGAAFVYYGNEGGLSYKPIQVRNDETTMIIAPLKSRSTNGFKIGLTGRNYMGIDNVKLQWEVKALGIPFDGSGLTESADWYQTGLNGIDIIEQVDGLNNDTYYKWRVRIKYDMVKGMLYPYSRWFYIADNAPMEVDVRTGVYTGIREKRISIDKNNQLMDFSVYKDMKLLNGEIQEKGLTIYAIDGRKLNRIISVGQYYIIKKMNDKIISKQKILIF